VNIPSTLTAGDLWAWTESQTDYPAPTWELSFHFSGPKSFSAVGVASGTDHAFSVAATATKDQPHGTYEWIARAVNGTTSTTLARGRITVEPNFANLAADNRTHNRKVYEALKAVIENRATTDQLSYSVAGRSISRMSWDELLAAHDRYRLAVAKEMGLHPGRVFIRTGTA
jgi:hypothetical protein